MTKDSPPDLVAIGASAGGIQALHQFFAKMPSDSGLAFVVVLHLPAGRRSMLPEILPRWSSMAVTEAHDDVAIKANHVLVLPGGGVAELQDGHLLLHELPREIRRISTPIDAFFASMADGQGEDAPGVILSGTGHDCSLELRSSNEELQSANEELQSANEELETSREEIQPINEELNTVNVQLSSKVEQLDRANGDLKNLFDSTRVATVFLDTYLIIRSFTPEIASIHNLIPGDVGRPLTDISGQLNYTTLREDVQTALKMLRPVEHRVQRQDGSAHYLMRILPYRSPDGTIDGSLIIFVDVTSIVRAEEHQRLLVDELNHRVKNMLTVVISLAANTLRQADTMEGFKDVLLGRLHALTSAYTLLSRDSWSPVPLREVLLAELRPFLSGEKPNVTLTGPGVVIEPRTALALALGMAVHELTTNSVSLARYRCLKVRSISIGPLTMRWI